MKKFIHKSHLNEQVVIIKTNSSSRWLFCTLFNEHNTHQVVIKFQISKSDAMNAKITSNKNLAKKLKKLGFRQETVLAGVADHLTEDEKSNINHVLSKMEQLSINIKVEEDKPPNQHTSEKTNFEAFFISFKHELCAYEESDKMDCLMFSTVD